MIGMWKGEKRRRQEDLEDQQYSVPRPVVDVQRVSWNHEPFARPRCKDIRSTYLDSIESTYSKTEERQTGSESRMIQDLQRELSPINYERVYEILRQVCGVKLLLLKI